MSVNLQTGQTWVSFAPLNEQAAQEVAKGNLGTDPKVTIEHGNVILATSHGTFTFEGPKLEEPDPNSNKSISDAFSTLSSYDTNSITDVFQLMMILQKTASQQKLAAREGRLTQQQAQQELLYQAAEDIRQAAAMTLAAGITSGAFKIASGAVQVGGGFKAMGSLSDQAKSQAISNQYMGASTGVGGVGEMVGAGFTYASSMEQAEQKEHEADAQRAGSYAEMETEFINNLKELIRDVQEKLQAIQQATDDTTKQILRA